MHESLKKLGGALGKWNVDVFGNIFYRKKRILARINRVQSALERNFHSGLLKLERKLKGELDKILREEEMLWFQKSREK